MPMEHRKARLLLKEGKAKIIRYEPFTIQLLYPTGEATQPISLGIDTGAKYVGVALVSEGKVLAKGTIELRDDVKKGLVTRKMYRKGRRFRNTRYRKPRFKNRKRPDGWLPPSVDSRVDNTFRWIDKFAELVPAPELKIEIGKFDIAKIENPDIEGEGYQKGAMYGYRNRIAYLLAREKGKCQYCHKKYRKGDGWRLHHIWGKDKDRPEDWALLHESCHWGENGIHKQHKEKKLQKKKSKSYKESTFMNIIRRRAFERYPNAEFTYGNITFQDRCDLGLEKSHCNDAVAITKTATVKQDSIPFMIRQSRVKKRSLHEANPRKGSKKKKNTAAKRNNKNTKYQDGFYLNDRVEYMGAKGFISGFCKNGVYVIGYDGKYITKPGKTYKQLPPKEVNFISHERGWQFIHEYSETKTQ